jgi:hypothetical protein
VSRAHVAIGPPDPRLDWTSFPAETSLATRAFRSHSTLNGPWHFSSIVTPDGGRFDLAGPYGTCYLAATVEGAVRERLGPTYSQGRIVPAAVAAAFVVTELDVPSELMLADLTDAAGARFGSTNELTTVDDYAIPQAWAQTFREAGFDGIRYLARFTPGKGPNAWALFGDSGPRSWRSHAVIDGPTATNHAGWEILPPPPTTAGTHFTTPPAPA